MYYIILNKKNSYDKFGMKYFFAKKVLTSHNTLSLKTHVP